VFDVIVGHGHLERVLTLIPDDSDLNVGSVPRWFVNEGLAYVFTASSLEYRLN
jgi:hypothetical protein